MLSFLWFWRNFCVFPICCVAFFAVEQNSRADDSQGTSSPPPRQRLLDAGVEEIVFAVRQDGVDGHWYANFGHYGTDENRKTYRDGGQLVRLNLKTGETKVLLDDPKGAVRDPVVHYDAKKILFSYRPGGSEHYHLYEIEVDGTGLRQLTDGDFDDVEPCYLPDGDIVFVSSRCNRFVSCWLTPVAILYRCDAEGKNVHAVSGNIEHDNTPWVLPDGRILYQRWEYVDRSQVHYHHLWTANPDGTGQMVYYGNLHPGTLMIDARPIPGTQKVVVIFSPGHGINEHRGAVVIVDPTLGPDREASAFQLPMAGEPKYRDPWAFSENLIMVTVDHQIVLLVDKQRQETLYELPEELRSRGLHVQEPRPLICRERETIIPKRTSPESPTGQLILTDVYEGRNMVGVKRGEIKKLLVLEQLPKPVNFTGGMDPLTYGGSFNLERVLGTIPVEPDGSAYMELPAMRPLFFVALDENDMSVKRMQSFLSVMPGEVTSCVGCHEQRTKTIIKPAVVSALTRAPSQIEPIPDCPDVFDFTRDIQPILDRHCVACHGYEKTQQGGPYAGHVILTGDHGPLYSHSYFTMTICQLFADGRNQPTSNKAPRTIGSSASRILKMLDGSHYDVKATEHEKKMLRLWIEAGVPYPGTYAALGCGSIGGYIENQQVNTDYDWPTTKAAGAVIADRCAACHQEQKRLPSSLSDESGVSFWSFDVKDVRLNQSRHIVFNLSRPEQSLMLLAPLAEEAGGFGLCKNSDGSVASVFTTREDPGYQTLLAMIDAGRENLEKIKRFDMPGFQPSHGWFREMRRYGIIPKDRTDDQPIDYYDADRRYWHSLWYQPE